MTKKVKTKLGSAKEEKAKTFTLSDPEKADRKLQLSSGKTLEFKAGSDSHKEGLTASEAKEIKEKYPYLKVE